MSFGLDDISRSLKSRLRVTAAFALVAVTVIVLMNPVGADSRSTTSTSSRDSAHLVGIGHGRKLALRCRGSGGPTVVLISGFRGAYDDWTHVVPHPGEMPRPSRASVFPRVGEFTRVCAYDRPGTIDFGGALTP